MKKLFLFTALLCVLFIPPIHAVTNAQLSINDVPQTPGSAFVNEREGVTLRIDFSPTPFVYSQQAPNILVEVRGEGNTVIASRVLNIFTDCSQDCSVGFNNVNLPTNFFLAITEDPTQETTTLQYTLLQDNSPPTIQLDINGCARNCAFNDPGVLRMRFADEGSGIDGHTIELFLDGTPVSRQQLQCEENTCTYTLPPRDVDIQVVVADRAGNRAERATIQAVHDTSPPILIQEPRPGGIYTQGAQLPINTPIPFSVIVEETGVPTLEVRYPFQNVSGSCTRRASGEREYVCSVTLTVPAPYTGPLTFIVSDAAGNNVTTELPVTFLSAAGDIEPNFWNIHVDVRRAINVDMWAVHDQTIPLDIRFSQRQNTPPAAAPIRMELQNCELIGSATDARGSVREIRQPQAINQGSRRTTIELDLAAQGRSILVGDANVLIERTVRCEVQIYSRLGNFLYTTPERETIEIPLRFVRLPPARDMIERRLQKSVEEYEATRQRLATLQQVYAGIQTICSARAGTHGINTAAAATALSLQPVGLHDPMMSVSKAMDKVEQGFQTSNIAQVCEFMACSMDDNLLSPIGTVVNPFSNEGDASRWVGALGGAETAQGLVNPYKSIVTAINTLCIPAMMYHMEMYLSILCQEAACVAEAPSGVQSVDACTFAKGQQMCSFVAGSLYHATPMHLFDSILTQVERALQNPFALLGIGLNALCPIGGIDNVNLWCAVPRTASDFGEVVSTVMQIRDAYQTATNLIQGQVGACQVSPTSLQLSASSGLPTSQTMYCNSGFVLFEQGGKSYSHANGRTCALTTPHDASVLTGEESVIGKTLDCNPAIIPPQVATAAEDRYRSCFGDDEYALANFLKENGADLNAARNNLKGAQDNRDNSLRALQEANENLDARRENFRNSLNTQHQNEINALETRRNDRINDLSYVESVRQEAERRINEDIDARLEALNQLNAQQRAELERFLNDPSIDDRLDFLPEADVNQFIDATGDLEEKQQEVVNSRDALRKAERELRREARTIKSLMIREDLRTAQGFIRRGINTGILFGETANAIGGLFGFDVSLGMGSIPDGIASIRSAPEKAFTERMCSMWHTVPEDTAAIVLPGGRTIAHLSATREEIDGTNFYSIQALMNVLEGSAEEVVISLEGAGSEVVSRSIISQSLTRTGANALAHTSERRFTQVCMTFPEPLTTYFSDAMIGVNDQERSLCTRIR